MTKRVSVTECPNCGAPVTLRDVADTDTPSCAFCQTVLPCVSDPPPAPTFIFTPFTPSSTMPAGLPMRTGRKTKALVWGILLTTLLIVGVSVAVPLLMLKKTIGAGGAGGGGGPINYEVSGSVVAAGSGNSSQDAYVIAPNVDVNDTPVLRLVDLHTEKVLWSTGAIPGSSEYAPTVLAAGSTALVVYGTNVLAYAATTGKRLWQGSIGYGLAMQCTYGDCAIVIGAELVALEADGTVQSLDVKSGRQLWSRRLADTPHFLENAGGLAAIVSSPKSPADDMLLFNPATGTERSIVPVCASDGQGDPPAVAGFDSPFEISPDGKTLTVVIDGSGGCVASYRIANQAPLWRTPPDAQNSQIPFTFTGQSAVSGEGVVAWTNDVGSDVVLFAVNTSTGKIRELIDGGNQDNTTTLDGVVDGTLVMEQAPSYASDQPGIYGISVASGKQLWMDPSRVTSASDDGTQTVVTTGRGLVFVSCKSSADGSNGSCRFEAIDPATGNITGTLNVDSLGPAPTVDDVTTLPDEVLGNVNEGMAIGFEAANGNFVGQWPRTS